MDIGKKIVIGTRGSALALKQSDIVSQALHSAVPECVVEVKIITTEGDSNFSPIPLDTVGKGWFTKEIEKELLEGTIDVAVHSLKDLSETLPRGLSISAYLDREDPRDVLISRDAASLLGLPEGAVVGTDSIRRKVQILELRDDFLVESIRGNVLTRLEKLDRGDYDAIVLAAAGIIRLNVKERITQYFSSAEIMPAPGQGILAIETREDDEIVTAHMQKINDRDVACVAQAERTFSRACGGGCKTPVGAYARIRENELLVEGMIMIDNGSILRGSITGNKHDAQLLGEQLAAKMS